MSRDSQSSLKQEEINPKSALHRPEEEYSKLANEPLEDPIVKAELDKGHEKYNSLMKLQLELILKGGIPSSETI